ncbi:MAG: hypothetical protein GKR89_29180 [Candidatus Latescibacteria bacterium]|nr:hypothetical protein [Candidatus Latescibacterota bacterium]
MSGDFLQREAGLQNLKGYKKMKSKSEIVKTVKAEGVYCLPNLLSKNELDETRQDLGRACRDAGHEAYNAGERTRLSGEVLLKYPAIARVFSDPQILELCSSITEEPIPFLQEIVANRYIPPHPGIAPHSDEDFGELVPPFMRVTWALFLDDISAQSGALLYAPGTHWHHYLSKDDPEKKSPTQEQIRTANYVPIELMAGTLILRAPEVWHAVAPIHHLRRYITGSYSSRNRVSSWLGKDIARLRAQRQKVKKEDIPEGLRNVFYSEAAP